MKKPIKPKTGRRSRYAAAYQGLGGGRSLALGTLLLVVVVSTVIAAGWLAWQQLSQWSFFQLTAVRIEGCEQVSKDELLELSGVDIHSNLLRLSPSRIKARLTEHEWVAGVRVRRDWPNRLEIVIREHRPLALLAQPDGLHYVDRQGEVFAPALPPGELDFPVITGLGPRKRWQAEQRQGLQRGLRLLRLAARNAVLPAQGISEINLDEDNKLALFMVSHPFPVYLGAGEQLVRDYRRLVKVLRQLYKRELLGEIAAIQLDYLPDRVLVEKERRG